MNPAKLVKLIGVKSKLSASHPDFAAHIKGILAGGFEEGTVIEVTLTKPGQEPVVGSMKVATDDMDMMNTISDIFR